MLPIQSRRNFIASLSAKLRRNGINSQRTDSSGIRRGLSLTPSVGFCLGTNINVQAYDERDAQEFIDDITALLAEWGNPHSVGEIRNETDRIGYHTVRIHAESTRGGFPRCGAARAQELRALADKLDPPNPTN